MATIPIEIILQDAETPVDPTPTPEETNIVVPDTGAGTVGSSSTFSSSSAASIILPAILLVVALATICTVLVHKHRKHQNDKLSKKEKLATATSAAIAVLSATVLVGNLAMPATNAATSVEPGTAELETEDKITIIATREQDSDTITTTVKDTSYVTANLDFGYKVSASMAEGTTTANLYLDGNTDSPYYIAPVENAILGDNTWGYRLSEEDEDYLTVPLANTPAIIMKGNDNTIEYKPVDIYYTVQIDKDMPTGTYRGEIEYTLTDNNFPSTLTSMQDMTTEICENTYTPSAFKADGTTMEDNVPTVILKDIRDNKMYRVAKLADGKCWMTQNLDLQKESLVVASLNSSNTDNPADEFELPDSQASGSESWENGEIAIYTDTAHLYDLNGNGQTYYECMEYRNGPGCIEWSGQVINSTELGNYYNWYVATAGTGSYSLGAGEMARGSICPMGWKLPLGAEGGKASDFSLLLAVYGILESPYSSTYDENFIRQITSSPLSFISAGKYDSGVKTVGENGNIWSAMATGYPLAQPMSFSMLYLSPWGGNYIQKSSGFSVRCVAR